MSRVAILQSNYLPWRGYFDMIAKVDEFIVYDSCQYTVNDWRNRNQVKGRDGLIWLTVPVLTKGRTGQLITDAAFAETNWATKHLSTIRQTLGRAPHFDTIDELLSRTLETSIGTGRLHQVNVALLRALAGALQLDTRLTLDSDYGELDGERSARVAELAGRAGATSYLTGPRGLDYLDPAPFDERGIALEVIDYSTLAPYPQLFGEFAPAVSVIDLLANCGPESPAQLTSVVRRVERAGEQLLPGDVLATDGGSP
jgi:hypothetical protein